MTQGESKKVFSYIIKRCKMTAEGKNKIYASNFNVLSNFYSAGKFQDCSPQRALFGMLSKHLIALKDFTHENVSSDIDMSEWEEKIVDSIVYLIRLYEIIIEESRTISMFNNHTKVTSDNDMKEGEI